MTRTIKGKVEYIFYEKIEKNYSVIHIIYIYIIFIYVLCSNVHNMVRIILNKTIFIHFFLILSRFLTLSVKMVSSEEIYGYFV